MSERLQHSDAAEAFASYVPQRVCARLCAAALPIEVPERRREDGALIFVDIAGFTPLTERLARRGAAGAEDMARVIGDHFAPLVDAILAHGGDVIDFAGDAILASFSTSGETPGDLTGAAARAAACAAELQVVAGASGREAKLSVKIGVAAGAIDVLHVGGVAGHRFCLVGGPAQRAVMRAEASAAAGMVVLAPEVADLLGARVETSALPGGHRCLERIVAAPEPCALVPVVPNDRDLLRAYVPEVVQQRIDAGQHEWLAELRRVSNVFANVVGLRTDDDDDVRRLNDVSTAIDAAAERFGGRVHQLIIDDKGTVAVIAFGLPPRAHEDDPARAARAALEIEAAIAARGLRSAIGVTTGSGFCGPIGSPRRRKYMVTSDRMNLAARLMQAALDDILCDSTTAAALGAVSFQALPAIRVKGKSAPIAVYRPHGRRTTSRPARETPLVGRERERRAIGARIEALVTSGGRASLLVEGEAGIGKSKLLAAVIDDAERAGARVLYGAGESIESAAPLHGWRGIVEELLELGGVADDPGARRRHILRTLRDDPTHLELLPLLNPVLRATLDVPDTPTTAALAGAERAERTRRFLIALLLRVAEQRPTVVVVDDAHWLDSASWALLCRVARVELGALLVVVGSRPLPELPAFRSFAESATHRITLDALGPDETRALVAGCLGVSELPATVEALVRERGEGHPYFSEELVRALRDTGHVRVEGQSLTLTPKVDLRGARLPDTVQGVLLSRLDALSPEQQLLLKVASVIGRAFAVSTLHEVYPMDCERDELVALLTDLEVRDLVRLHAPDPERAYAFKHAILRDVAYDSMLFAQRRALHGRIAEWLEAHRSEGDPSAEALAAHHWSHAAGERTGERKGRIHRRGRPRHDTGEAVLRARDALVRAGATAVSGGAFDEGVALLRRSQILARRLSPGDRSSEHEREIAALIAQAEAAAGADAPST